MEDSVQIADTRGDVSDISILRAVALAVNAGSLEFTVSYIVDYTERTATKDRLFTKIAEEITNSNGRLDWASSSTAASMASER